MTLESHSYPDALLKLVCEPIENATDNIVAPSRVSLNRKKVTTTVIRVHINATTVRVESNGEGIPVLYLDYKDESGNIQNLLIPEVMVSHMNAGTNLQLEKSDIRAGVGRNGVGLKCTNGMSSSLKFRIVDPQNKKIYEQHFEDGCSIIHPASVKDFTKTQLKKNLEHSMVVQFIPELSHFKDVESLECIIPKVRARLYKAAAYFGSAVKIYFNNKLCSTCQNLKQYMKCFGFEDGESAFIRSIGMDLQIGFGVSITNTFHFEACVGGLDVEQGGPFIDKIKNIIVNAYMHKYNTQRGGSASSHSRTVNITRAIVLSKLFLCVFYRPRNPEFSSQTKLQLVTPIPQTTLKDWKKIVTTYLNKGYDASKLTLHYDAILQDQDKETPEISQQAVNELQRIYENSLHSIHQLRDAVHAGVSSRYSECTLYIGLRGITVLYDVVDNYTHGVLEVDSDILAQVPSQIQAIEAFLQKQLIVPSHKRPKIAQHLIFMNRDVNNIANALGLIPSGVYTAQSIQRALRLRYNKVCFVLDSSPRGTYVLWQLLYLFYVGWPELLQLNLFYRVDIPTKITYTKIQNATQVTSYTEPILDISTLPIQTLQERLASQEEIELSVKNYDLMNVLFENHKRRERNAWLEGLSHDNGSSTHKSRTHLLRVYKSQHVYGSDGFRPGQRHVIQTALKIFSNLTQTPMYMQASMDIPTFVHHISLKEGETPIMEYSPQSVRGGTHKIRHVITYMDAKPISYPHVIIKMVQNYVGRNNVPLFTGIGMFGTRIGGSSGKTQSKFKVHSFSGGSVKTGLGSLRQKKIQPIAHGLDTSPHHLLRIRVPTYFYKLFPPIECSPDNPKEDEMWPTIPLLLCNTQHGQFVTRKTQFPLLHPLKLIEGLIKRTEYPASEMKWDQYIVPYYHGFTGKVYLDKAENNKNQTILVTEGVYSKLSRHTVKITEIPVHHYSLEDYKNRVLVPLMTKQMLESCFDYCTPTQVHFEVTFARTVSDKLDLMNLLELKKSVEIHLNVMMEENVSKNFESIPEYLEWWYTHKLCSVKSRMMIQTTQREEELSRLLVEEKILTQLRIRGMGSKGMHTMMHGRQVARMKTKHDVRDVMKGWCKNITLDQSNALFQKPLAWFCESDVISYQELLRDKHERLFLRLDSERVYQNDLRELKSLLERELFDMDVPEWIAPTTVNGIVINENKDDEEGKQSKKSKKRKLRFSSDRRFDPNLERNRKNNTYSKKNRKNKKRKKKHKLDTTGPTSSSSSEENGFDSDYEDPTREEMDDAHTENMMYRTLGYKRDREYRTQKQM
ncbi:MAG: DNA gyrase subunit A [Promethearchaeota archaeon]